MKVADFKNIVWDYTRKISDCMNNVFNPVCERHGLTLMQARIIMELHRSGSHTIGSLAESTCVAGTNISAMCKKLECKGLVHRVRNQEDERVVKVALTKLGDDTVSQIDNLIQQRIEQQLQREAEETLRDIINGLQKLNDLLQKMNVENKE